MQWTEMSVCVCVCVTDTVPHDVQDVCVCGYLSHNRIYKGKYWTTSLCFNQDIYLLLFFS